VLERNPQLATLDLTGGAPELNPHFRTLVHGARALGRRVLDRCNLTVLLEPGQEDTAEFLAAQRVEVVASLPCYTQSNVDAQRGKSVYERSLAALRALNALGYAQPSTGLALSLVYNPLGAFLPAPQEQLEADYERELGALGIAFDRLLTITNMPIKRFARELARNAELKRRDGARFELVVPKSKAYLADRNYQEKLKAVLEQHLGTAVTIKLSVGETSGATAAAIEAGERDASRAAAAQAVQKDGFVNDLVNLLDGKVVDSSIRPEGK